MSDKLTDEQINKRLAEFLGLNLSVCKTETTINGDLVDEWYCPGCGTSAHVSTTIYHGKPRPANFTESVDALQPVLDMLIEKECEFDLDFRITTNEPYTGIWYVDISGHRTSKRLANIATPSLPRALALACVEAIEKMEGEK